MKKIVLILLLLNFVCLDLSSQTLEGKDKQVVNINGRSKSVRLDTLAKFYSPIRTPYGNVAKVDSNLQIKNVSFYDNSTIVNNSLVGNNALFNPDVIFTNGDLEGKNNYYLGGTYKGYDRGSFSIAKDVNNGVGFSGWVNPRPGKSGWNTSFISHANMTNDSANFVSNNPSHAMMNFVVVADKWDTLTGNWLGSRTVKNAPLFGFHHHGLGYQMGIWADSVKVYRDFVVGNAQLNQTKYFEVTPSETKINNFLKLPHVSLKGLNFGGYQENGVYFSVLRLEDNYEENRTILFQLSSNDGQGWGRKYASSSQGRSLTLNRDFWFLNRLPNDTLYERNQGVFIDVVVNSDKARRGQTIYNLSGTSNGKTSEMMIIQDSLNNPLFLFTHVGVKNHSWAEHEANASVIMYKDSTVINNTLKLNSGVKFTELSYVPENSNDLQAETINAEVGTLWMLNVSGSMYLVTKISETKIARTPFAEW